MNATSDSHPDIHTGGRSTLPSLGGVMSGPRPTPSQSLLSELLELLDEVRELKPVNVAARSFEEDDPDE